MAPLFHLLLDSDVNEFFFFFTWCTSLYVHLHIYMQRFNPPPNTEHTILFILIIFCFASAVLQKRP